MRIATFFIVGTCFFGANAEVPQASKEVHKLAELLNGSWDALTHFDGKDGPEKDTFNCKDAEFQMAVECLWAPQSADDGNPEKWFFGYDSKTDRHHLFVVSPKSAHDHVVKWDSESSIAVEKAPWESGCGVISMKIEKKGRSLLLSGTEKDKSGKIVKFESTMKPKESSP